jgi:hypothetical protein
MRNEGEPGPSGRSWVGLVALWSILIFAMISIGVFHMNAGDVAAMSVGLGGLFRDWRDGE